MNNVFIERNAMFLVLACRRWLKDNAIPEGHKLYMACRLECDRIPIARPWPLFCARGDYHAFVYAKEEWPLNNHVVSINPDPTIHPRNAVREI